MIRLTGWLDGFLRNFLVLLMVSMVVAVSWQVISRYVLSSPSSWTEEVARFLLIWIGLLGAAYAFRTNAHLGLDLVPSKLTGSSAQLLKRFTFVMILVFAITVLIVGGGLLVNLTWELRQYSAVLGMPMAYVYSVIPISGVLICLFAVDSLRSGALSSSPVSPEGDLS